MKDESSYMYLHRQLGMQVSSCSETGNNPHTYTCVDLYMASPLEKSRELEVLISHRIRTALPLAPAGQWAVIREGEESQGVGSGRLGGRERERGFKLGGDLAAPIERSRFNNRLMASPAHVNWGAVVLKVGKSPRILWLSCDLNLMTRQRNGDETLHFPRPWSPFVLLLRGDTQLSVSVCLPVSLGRWFNLD